MAGKTQNLLCGRCDTAVETVPNPKPQDMVVCPRCGNSDTFKNVMRIIDEGLQEATAALVHKTLKQLGLRNKTLKVSTSPVHKRKRAFYVKLDL